jgi:hypothetical protein
MIIAKNLGVLKTPVPSSNNHDCPFLSPKRINSSLSTTDHRRAEGLARGNMLSAPSVNAVVDV